jgi:zinc/manganese transport system ATP-binding protein
VTLLGPPVRAPPLGPDGRGPADRPAVVRAEALGVHFAGVPVWTDAGFDVRAGEFVAVIGPNGAGKTTLFRLLLGLHRDWTGTLEVLGRPPRRGNPRIGYVPQRHTVDYETNVAAVHLVHLALTGSRWGPPLGPGSEMAAARAALEAVDATELGDKALGAMSGGELQRVFLAEALVGRPDLLLLDEPLSNLDLRRSRELVALVHGIVRERGIAAMFVAHDINPLIPFLDKVVYIANAGVASGPPGEVLTSARLSRLYGVPVEVLHDSQGHIVIVGGEGHVESELGGGEGHHEGEGIGGTYAPRRPGGPG